MTRPRPGCWGRLWPALLAPTREVPTPQAVVELFELRRAFQLRPQTAAALYGGRWVRTWGIVHRMDGDTLYVWPETVLQGTWRQSAPVCAAQVGPVSGAWSPGDPIVVEGQCQGLDPLDVLVLRPARIVEDVPRAGELAVRRRGGHLVRQNDLAWVLGGDEPGASRAASHVDVVTLDGVRAGPALPAASRPAAFVGLDDGRIVALGGLPPQSVWVLDAGRWRAAPGLPQPCVDGAACAVGAGVWIGGGVGSSRLFGPPDWRREAFWLAPEATTWRPCARLPQPRRGGTMVALDGARVAWIGGEDPEGSVEDALVYDVEADAWEIVACGPPGLSARGVAVLADGRVLLAGGQRAADDVEASCHVWEPASGIARPLPDLTVARRRPMVLALPDGSALVLGGAVNEAHDPKLAWPSAAVEWVQPGSAAGAAAVHPQPALGTPRMDAHVALIGADVVIMGGIGVGGEVLRSVERRRLLTGFGGDGPTIVPLFAEVYVAEE